MAGGGLGILAGTLAVGLPTREEVLLEILGDVALVANGQDLEERGSQLYHFEHTEGGTNKHQ